MLCNICKQPLEPWEVTTCEPCSEMLQDSLIAALTQTEKQSTLHPPAARCSRTSNQQGAKTMTNATTSKTYAFAIVPTQGRYGSGDIVRVARLSNDLDAARKFARKLSDEYQRGMRPYGGSSGGYRVIAWGSADRTASGYWINHCPDAK